MTRKDPVEISPATFFLTSFALACSKRCVGAAGDNTDLSVDDRHIRGQNDRFSHIITPFLAVVLLVVEGERHLQKKTATERERDGNAEGG